MKNTLRRRILYALGCALVQCVCSLAPRLAIAQPSEPPGVVAGARALPALPNERGVVEEQVPGVVNLNTATAAELERLPRIGPARAQAILALRAKLTRFSKVEQLLRVKGIGRATFRKLRPLLALDGATTLPERR